MKIRLSRDLSVTLITLHADICCSRKHQHCVRGKIIFIFVANCV
jgi:hypothetical protein